MFQKSSHSEFDGNQQKLQVILHVTEFICDWFMEITWQNVNISWIGQFGSQFLSNIWVTEKKDQAENDLPVQRYTTKDIHHEKSKLQQVRLNMIFFIF